MPNVDDVLLAKDTTIQAHQKYNEWVKIVDKKHKYLPSLYQLKNRITYWNEKVKSSLSLSQTDQSVSVSLSLVCKLIAKFARLKKNIPIGNIFHFKLTMDESKGVVSIGLIPLNLKCLLSQQLSSIFNLVVFKGKESMQFIKKYANHIAEDCKKLIKNGFFENGELYKVAFTWVSDLKSFWAIFNIPKDQFCPFCTILKSQTCTFLKYPKRVLENYFGISHYTFCSLHCECRVTEKLLKLITFNREDLVIQLVKIVAETTGIKGFSMSFEDVQESDEISYLKCCMLKGDDALKIIRMSDKILSKLKEYCTNRIEYQNIKWREIELIFKYWRFINQLLHIDSGKLKNLNFSKIQFILFVWKFLLITTFGNAGISFYIHILVDHLVEILQQDCLPRYSQQSFENAHQDRRMQHDRGSTNGGGWHKLSPVVQFMMRMYRIFLIGLEKLQTIVQ
jgi:hypothetical protein